MRRLPVLMSLAARNVVQIILRLKIIYDAY